MEIMFNVWLFIAGAVIGGVVEYIIVKMKGRGQVIRDGVMYSCELIGKDKDVDKFVKIFQEMTGAFLGRD